ncbi:MAG TPA: FAD-dependent oxidoreductase [Azospirillaceae bacterium]|nr:FAD-dependent oxidoreductase [Azospirillaceae bacterium]
MIRADLCVIGGGSAGLSVAAGAAQMGADVVLIERGRMGGECLNTGCVPSKALLAAARAAQAVREAVRFGVRADGDGAVDFAAVHRHVHGAIAAIAPHDSQARFEGLGVRVLRSAARFTGPDRVETADGHAVAARRFVIATGSRPFVPPIPGLDSVPYLTNETVFARTTAPDHLIVIGGGPIGCEMAQAHRRLGSRVTLLERGTILPKDDPEPVALLRDRLRAEGVDLREGTDVVRVAAGDGRGGSGGGGGVAVTVSAGGVEQVVTGTDILVAVGRTPDIHTLDLAAAGIEAGPHGVKVDARLRTTNPRVFAIGDAAGGPQFTHVAGHHAGIVLRNALFRLPSKVDYTALPWVTYTDPELANVGLTEAQARERHRDVEVLRWPFADNDRARTEGTTGGFVKAVVRRNGRILGATIVGPHAGELIQTWALAIHAGLKVGALATMIAPYPTLGEASKSAAGQFYAPKLFGPRTRALVRLLRRLG